MSLYTHHLGYAAGSSWWRDCWTRLQIGVTTICADAAAHGIDMHANTNPAFITIRVVEGSGNPALTLYGPDFPVHSPDGWLLESVSTDRAPWDPWMCAVILRAHLLAPACTAIGSDGTWAAEWTDGLGAEVSDAAPRRIVARLFAGRILAADHPDLLRTPSEVAAGPPFPANTDVDPFGPLPPRIG